MDTEKKTTLWVNSEDADVYREFSAKTKIDIIDLQHEIAKEIKTILEEGIPEGCNRINFMAKAFIEKGVVVLYFSGMNFGTIGQLGFSKEQQTQIEKTFDYARDPKTGALIDLREKKVEK